MAIGTVLAAGAAASWLGEAAIFPPPAVPAHSICQLVIPSLPAECPVHGYELIKILE
jgi:hypothetical protein